MTRWWMTAACAVLLVAAGCFDAPVTFEQVDVHVTIPDSLTIPTGILAAKTDAEREEWIRDDLWIATARELRVRAQPLDAADRQAHVRGAIADTPGEIGLGSIKGRVGSVVSIPVGIVADDFDLGPDGIQAFGLDLIFPATTECLLDLGGMSEELVSRGWYMGGHNARVINGVQYVRVGAFAGSGVGIMPGEAVDLYDLSFRIVAGGEGEAVVWRAMDHIGWYTSDAPMPFFDSRCHVYGCWRYSDVTVGMTNPIDYEPAGSRHVAAVYANASPRNNPEFGDFSLDVRYPVSCDWIYGAAGVTTRYYESVTVTQVAPGLLRVVGVLGTGSRNTDDYGWGQIVRLDFVPHATGVVEWWELENMGGSLAGMTTACAR